MGIVSIRKGIILSGKSFEVLILSVFPQELKDIMRAITPVVLQSNIHSTYKFGNNLGSGATGKVYEGLELMDPSVQVAIKAVPVEIVLEDKN